MTAELDLRNESLYLLESNWDQHRGYCYPCPAPMLGVERGLSSFEDSIQILLGAEISASHRHLAQEPANRDLGQFREYPPNRELFIAICYPDFPWPMCKLRRYRRYSVCRLESYTILA